MNAIDRMLRRFLPQPAEPTNGTPPVSEDLPYPILCGMVRENGRWKLIIGDNGAPRIRMVIVPSDVVSQYNELAEDDAVIQRILESLPFSYRKRKRRAKVEEPNPRDVAILGGDPSL